MSSWSWKAGLAGAAVLAATAYALAQMGPGHDGMHDRLDPGAANAQTRTGINGSNGLKSGGMHGYRPGPMDGQMQGHHGMHSGMGPQATMDHRLATAGRPTMPGQDAFGAIQEIVQILQADPTTDWSKVNIAALREHLIDMNEVTLHAEADVHALENGVEIAVTGQGRTRDAIRRMVPAHVRERAPPPRPAR